MASTEQKAAGFRIDPVEVTLDDLMWTSQVPLTCPDPTPGSFQVDAKIWLGRFEYGRLREYEIRQYHSQQGLRKLRESVRAQLPKRAPKRLREGGRDWFAYDEIGLPQTGLLGQFLPLIPGPATRQQYWSDYFATSAKAFEAYHHDPIARRAMDLQTEFILGRGIEARVKGDAGQEAWEAFWKANNMDARLEEMVRDLALFGELIIRYFDSFGPEQLVVRSLDPATIYEIVTDQEDRETVFFYHQQYQTRTELYSPPGGNLAPQGATPKSNSRFVIRQIPAEEIDHIRVNAVSSEVRGRPDLFPALGHLKRLRDLITSRIVKADMEARMVYKLVVEGTPADIQNLRRQLFPNGKPPNPGTVLGVNKQVDLEGMNFTTGDGTVQHDYEALLNLIAVGVGLPKEYLGITGQGTRATALVATEPGAKRFESRQKVVERILHRMADRVFDRAGLTGEDREIEFIFPAIATEDRSSKLKDLAFAESNNWLSKETTASTAAKELDFSTFDFEEEQRKIADEWADADDTSDDGAPASGDGKIRRPMISSQYRQAPKLNPTRAQGSIEDDPPGLAVPTDGSDPAAAGEAATRAGMPADENPLSQAGAANIRTENGQARESDRISVDAAARMVREAAQAVARAARPPRRRPDDPDFQRAAKAYRTASAESLDELRRAVIGT
jgi:hypothetical protein